MFSNTKKGTLIIGCLFINYGNYGLGRRCEWLFYHSEFSRIYRMNKVRKRNCFKSSILCNSVSLCELFQQFSLHSLSVLRSENKMITHIFQLSPIKRTGFFFLQSLSISPFHSRYLRIFSGVGLTNLRRFSD